MQPNDNSPERRVRYWNLIRQASPKVVWDRMTSFMLDLDTALERFRAAERNRGTYRDAHEALRDLWMLLEQPQPDVVLIRRKLSRLPSDAVDYVLRRARQRLHPFSAGWLDFIRWTGDLGEADFVSTVRSLVSTGAAWSFGQTRSNGKMSDPHLEPMILGHVRRLRRPDVKWFKPPPHRKFGRPAMTAVDELLTELGLLWLETTGVEPRAVKGHETPFVEMAKLALEEAGVKARKTAIERHFRSRRLHRERPSRVPWTS